ncbi:MAG: hypothetical protein IJW18_08825 [Lachnospiraceae bacterium]|nr:hypothetical protein [Lachnospiraceae bacterium]
MKMKAKNVEGHIEPNYKKNVKYYNTSKLPMKQRFIFTWLIWLLSKVSMGGVKYKVEKINMEGVKPPYILLSNHMYFVDFKLNAFATYPYPVNNVATVDGYYRRPWLMELIGCICKRKFTNDLMLIKSIQHSLKKHKSILCMYPEARYSPAGTTAILPEALGKLIKLSKMPVVVTLHHGNYLRTPFWDKDSPRKVPLYTTMTHILSAEDVQTKSVDEINEIVKNALTYDEYAWQEEQEIRITEDFRARGLHKILYKCPACKAESNMASEGIKLWCKSCGRTWEMTELGRLEVVEEGTATKSAEVEAEVLAQDGEASQRYDFSRVPEWFEWERSEVRKEILAGTYHFEDEVDVFSLPHPAKFIDMGKAKLVHDYDGFKLEGIYNGERYCIKRSAIGMNGLHVEYDYVYVRPEDCIDISTDKDSFYCYPKKNDVITKLSFATEELYRYEKEKLRES